MQPKLTSGDTFPAMSLDLMGGGKLNLPDDLGDGLTILLFYRGYW